MIKPLNGNGKGNGNGHGNGRGGHKTSSGNGDSFQSEVLRKLGAIEAFAEIQREANRAFLEHFRHIEHRMDGFNRRMDASEHRAEARERRQEKINRLLVRELQAIRRNRR